MTDFVLPALYATFVWWFSTVLIIYLDGLPRWTFRWSLLGATVILVGALWGLAISSADTSTTGLYVAFTCGLLAWGWQEISFYMGYVTGPRKEPCPEGCSGPKHFVHAVEVSLYHELAIVVEAAAVLALTWGQPNQVGLWAFLVLWWMHQSAKLNVFFGVRNLNEEFIPSHLDFLKRFLSKKPMNALFPVSVSVSTLITAWLLQRATAPTATSFEATAFTFLAVLMALAVLEHWLLVLPIRAGAIWSWGLWSRGKVVAPFDVDIAAGFLGAGKTTFLRRLLADADPNVRTVALVNDFSELGVDASLLRGRGADVVELANGCICCSLKNDLATQLQAVVARWAPERVLIEPSGVADVASLLGVLHRPDVKPMVKSLRVYTVIDAGAFLRDYARLPGYFETQAKLAPVFIVNKIDVASPAEVRTVKNTLRSLNPKAPILVASFGNLPDRAFDGLPVTPEWGMQVDEDPEVRDHRHAGRGQSRHDHHHHHDGHERDHGHEVHASHTDGADGRHLHGHHHHGHHHHDDHHHDDHHHGHHHHGDGGDHDHQDALGLTNWSMRLQQASDLQKLGDVLEDVARGAHGEILRLKGIARSEAGWIHFDVAGGRSSIEAFAPQDSEVSRIMVIGRSVDAEGLAAALERAYLQPAEADEKSVPISTDRPSIQ